MGTSPGFAPPPRRLAPEAIALTMVILLITFALAGPTSVAAQLWPERYGQGVCYSQYGWCPLPNAERIPLGVPCYCVLPDNRPIAGTTSNYVYRGRVNPYFNPHTAPVQVPTMIR